MDSFYNPKKGSRPPKGRVIRARWKAVRNYWKGGSRANPYLASLGWSVAGNSKAFLKFTGYVPQKVLNTTKEDTSVKKRILAAVLAAAMILGMAVVTYAASPFPDTEGIEEEGTIALLKTLGLVKGDDLGNFNPEDTITRAEFCTMIVRALGLETAAGYLATPTVFPDVTEAQDWAYGYINVAVTRGVIKGYPDGTFRPQGNVSQAEALTMVMRALGYKDSLPGDWPLDYIIAGSADPIGLVEAGFVPNESATRVFVAEMVARLLECEMVTEIKDYPGEFEGAEKFFGVEKLGVNVDGWSGMVTDVSTTNKNITIAGEARKYNSAVVVYGTVDSVSELKGYEVVTALNGKGEIIFVSTEGIDYITGKITAVDVADETLTIADTEYEVVSNLAATKNGVDLTGSNANKLVALAGTTANVWLDGDGDIYRIEARHLDQTNKVITKKTVAVAVGGTVYKLAFDGADLELAKEVTISRNGSPAGWANLEKGDNCDYAVEGGKIVWIDAWNQVIEDAQVTARYDLGSSSKQIVALVNGVSTTYQCTSDGFDVVSKVNAYYDLYVGRDGKVYGGKETTSDVLAVNGVIAGLSIETTVQNNVAKTVYKVILEDGSSFFVPLAKDWVGVKKNNAAVTIGEDVAKDFTDNFKVGDGVSADRVADGTVTVVRLYTTGLSGALTTTAAGFKIGDSGEIKLATSAKVTLNGATATLAEIAAATASARVTWDVEEGLATQVQGYNFKYSTETAVSGISESDGAYFFTVVKGDVVESSKDAVVIRDGVVAKLSDIALGDKVLFSTNGEYIEATSDTKAPALDGNVTASWDGGAKKYTLSIKFKEEVQAPKVWIAGVEVQFTAANTTDSITWTYTSAEFEAKPATVSVAITVKDYAGNALNATPGLITIP